MLGPLSLAALNHLLGASPWARQHLQAFAGRRAQLILPPMTLRFEIGPAGYLHECVDADDTPTDVTVRLPPFSASWLLQGHEKLFSEATVEGNAEFATALSFVLRHLRWDVEEDLARIVGDIAAHRIVQTGQRCLAWQRAAAQRLADNITEYLTAEQPTLVRHAELRALQDDLARLDAALNRVADRLASLRRPWASS